MTVELHKQCPRRRSKETLSLQQYYLVLRIFCLNPKHRVFNDIYFVIKNGTS
ncbi:hypothetical protein MPC4_70092 [Methylocella tundrae]|uniref:Uncharacterized protein n=1 Tax=Methylocella tundrae TaxID=227605 RepID=A0A8B6MBB4_METTU|nr:hypothetical protein MPC4_70092 [Methylocella tundrae]